VRGVLLGASAEVVLEVLVVGPAVLDVTLPPLKDEEVGVAPTPLDCWPCCVVLPVLCSPDVSLWRFKLWCVPPTAPPTTAQMITVVIATVLVMPLRVRYHGTLATTTSWPFDAADSSLRA